MQRKMYPSDMTDSEWEIIIPLIEKECPYISGQKVTLNEYREILNCIFYICKTGVQWEYIPHDFPPPTTVNCHYLKFSRNGLLEKINDAVRSIARTKQDIKKKKSQVAE
jgi:putative transposase